MIVMIKLMKDIIPKANHRLYKPDYLRRSWDMEEKRKRSFKALRKAGIPFHKAYQMSIKEMKK